MFSNVQLKFEKLVAQLSGRGKKNEVGQSIAMIGRILQQKTLKSLMRSFIKEIPVFFEFQSSSIMFHDNEKDLLYTITFGDDEEAQVQADRLRKNAKDAKELDYINTVESMRDAILSANNLICFPISTGITSAVYRSQKTQHYNDFNPTVNIHYVGDIDNISSLQTIANLAVCAMRREDGTTIGIIQLYNKQSPIMPQDVRKLDALSRCLGGCVENVEAITKKLTTTLAVQLETPASVGVLDATELFYDGALDAWAGVGKPLGAIGEALSLNRHADAAWEAMKQTMKEEAAAEAAEVFSKLRNAFKLPKIKRIKRKYDTDSEEPEEAEEPAEEQE